MPGCNNVIGLLDYGAGNLGSVARAVSSLGYQVKNIKTHSEMSSVEHLIFPGVGSAKQAMLSLERMDLASPLKDYAASGRPLLGICVGMQVLGQWSAEGNVECLGIFPYSVTRFDCHEPVPHMGWNSVRWNAQHSALNQGSFQLPDLANFYFVHSYAAFLSQDINALPFVLAESTYGGQTFCNFVARGNVWGSQCHIEKSGRAGLQFIANFLRSSGDKNA
jgi:imidazole glycerol phosphate synthase glutamine amidotransferase subunit